MAAALAAMLAGCSNGDAEPSEPEGVEAAEVCGGFAKETAASAALKAMTGADRFNEALSIPKKALAGLRDAVRLGQPDPTRPQGYAYCWLLPAGDGDQDFQIVVNAVEGAPGRAPRLAYMTTWYRSGVQAFATGGHGKVFFTCRLTAPAGQITIETEAMGPTGDDLTGTRRRTPYITLANAAARHISQELGCLDDGLAPGVPAAVPGT